jgi:hypothetical protein
MITVYFVFSVTVAIISEILPLLPNSQFSGILHSVLVLLKNIREATPHNSPSTPTEEIIEQIADKIIENNKL